MELDKSFIIINKNVKIENVGPVQLHDIVV